MSPLVASVAFRHTADVGCWRGGMQRMRCRTGSALSLVRSFVPAATTTSGNGQPE